MNYAEIKYNDIANGEGVRVSLFVSGCTHHCKNCFNSIAWDFGYGEKFDETVENKILDALSPGYVSGLTLLGGEPMEPANQKALLPFLKKVKDKYPNKNIWCYTGYEMVSPGHLEERAQTEDTPELLSLIDILVDGKFIDEQKDITLKFRGSRNQRIIDLKKTIKENKIVIYMD